MDPRNDVREFLVSRRARITPAQAGLRAYGANRRVKGLRREEVALLAGISAEYYVRLERGNLRGVSEDVLDGIARALQLDEGDRLHLFDLARAANTAPSRRVARRTPQEHPRPVIQRILDSLVGVPAFVESARSTSLLSTASARPSTPRSSPTPCGRSMAPASCSSTRGPRSSSSTGTPSPTTSSGSSGPKPAETPTTNASPTSSASSPPAARSSASVGPHHVKLHRTGVKRFHHPIVGDLTLDFERLDLPGDPGQKILFYSAEPASPSRERLDLLASWATTPAAAVDQGHDDR